MTKPKIIIPGTTGKPSYNDLVRYAHAAQQSLRNMSVRAHLLGCELHKVDPKNDIFNMENGVLDKEHLYHIRKALKDGQYEKNREICRLNVNPDKIKK